jgi:hypothetical protein
MDSIRIAYLACLSGGMQHGGSNRFEKGSASPQPVREHWVRFILRRERFAGDTIVLGDDGDSDFVVDEHSS